MSRKQKFRFRHTLGESRPRIDRENAIIHDVVAMHTGEALGHGVEADLKTLEIMARLGNAQRRGVAGRFGHIAPCENAAGKKVQVAKNFRVIDTETERPKLVHDSHLLKTSSTSPVFSKDPVEHLLNVAEFEPEHFGESVVIGGDTAWTFADGSEEIATHGAKRPDDALTDMPVLRPSSFYYVDYVNDGALTHDGMFSRDFMLEMFSGTSSEFSFQAFEILDEFIGQWTSEFNISQNEAFMKIKQLFGRYEEARTNATDATDATPETEIEETAADDAAPEAESTESGIGDVEVEVDSETVNDMSAQAQINVLSEAIDLLATQLESLTGAISDNFGSISEDVNVLKSEIGEVKSFQSAVKSSTPTAVLERLKSAADKGQTVAAKSVADADAPVTNDALEQKTFNSDQEKLKDFFGQNSPETV